MYYGGTFRYTNDSISYSDWKVVLRLGLRLRLVFLPGLQFSAVLKTSARHDEPRSICVLLLHQNTCKLIDLFRRSVVAGIFHRNFICAMLCADYLVRSISSRHYLFILLS